MSTFTSGRVNVTPVQLQSALSLAQLKAALDASPPVASTITGGWVGLDVVEAPVGQFGVSVPPQSKPAIEAAQGDYPERLTARFVFWRTDPQRAAMLPNAGTFDARVLEAVDVVISSEATGGFLALVSSRTEYEIDQIRGAIEDALHATDATAELDPTVRTSLHLGSDDLFLWLLERKGRKPEISPTITISSATGLDARDGRSRVNVIRDELDDARPTYLTAVADGNGLGPVRFALRLPAVPARIQLQLWVDGSFSVITSETHYSLKANIDNERLTAVQDLAYTLIPALIKKYKGDAKWLSSRRLAYVNKCRKALAKRYSRK